MREITFMTLAPRRWMLAWRRPMPNGSATSRGSSAVRASVPSASSSSTHTALGSAHVITVGSVLCKEWPEQAPRRSNSDRERTDSAKRPRECFSIPFAIGDGQGRGLNFQRMLLRGPENAQVRCHGLPGVIGCGSNNGQRISETRGW